VPETSEAGFHLVFWTRFPTSEESPDGTLEVQASMSPPETYRPSKTMLGRALASDPIEQAWLHIPEPGEGVGTSGTPPTSPSEGDLVLLREGQAYLGEGRVRVPGTARGGRTVPGSLGTLRDAPLLGYRRVGLGTQLGAHPPAGQPDGQDLY
jgi:hypothetical protein